uniref:Ig-like domain-containing protein n=1 Tax=Cricetulus griseus TaxID=10029 RepID=A0A8C2QPX1_CRIGR
MRYLTCLLLWVLQLVWGQWEDQLKNYPLRCLQISSFPNSSSFRTDGLAWLGDVQTHSWRNASTVSFLKPWSHEKPVAWLSSVLSPRHGHLQLVCHVSGFYPQPVWVMWTQGEQEQNSTQRGDILPNADGTWYLRATLDVEAGEEAGLACRVKHSSLGGQDIILYWDGRHSSYVVFIILAVLILAVGLGLGFVFICRKRW